MKKFEREVKIGIENEGGEEKTTEEKAEAIPVEEEISEKEIGEVKKEEKTELERTREELNQVYEKEQLKEIEKLENSSEKLKGILELIDKNIFPENPLYIKIVEEIKSKYKGKIPAAQHYFDEGKKGEMLNEHYCVNKEIDKEDYKLNGLIEVAIHEARHRVQHTFSSVGLFTRDNFKEFENKYPVLKLLEERLPKNLSPNDFDACLVENLSSFLRKNGVSLLEISKSIIPENAKEIFENIEILAEKKKFAISKN